jgi:UDP-3-O-[3-hydroxymyristoyl] N-acetylglucosamine deacetylase
MDKTGMTIAHQTLAQPVTCTGVGLHSGAMTTVKLLPSNVASGIVFVRVDLPDRPEVPAQVAIVQQTMLSTELVTPEGKVRTVEHLLAALWGQGITDVRIEIDGGELPLLDGSALEWVKAIDSAGIQGLDPEFDQPIHRPVLQEPIWVREGDMFVAAIPSSELRFSYGIDFDLSAIGNQWHSWATSSATSSAPSSAIQVESFAETIAPARTFGLAHQIDQLRAAGLIKGGSLDNALVCGPEGWINPPLRFPNEPVRHKLLDLIGDLSLVGPALPIAHYMAYKASHRLHTQLAMQLASLIH